jgi:hypothetical protein
MTRSTVFLLCFLFLSSCTPKSPPPEETFVESIPTNKVYRIGSQKVIPVTFPQIREWILNDACPTVCWEGIVVSETTTIEAAKIAEGLPFVRVVDIAKNENSRPYMLHIRYLLQTSEDVFEHQGIVLTANLEDSDALVIDEIEFSYLADQISLGDLIQVYGTPTHIRVEADQSADRPYWIVWILWMRENRGLETYMVLDDQPTVRIDEDLAISGGFRVKVPTNAEIQRQWNGFVPWQGSNTLEFYAAQLKE